MLFGLEKQDEIQKTEIRLARFGCLFGFCSAYRGSSSSEYLLRGHSPAVLRVYKIKLMKKGNRTAVEIGVKSKRIFTDLAGIFTSIIGMAVILTCLLWNGNLYGVLEKMMVEK